MQPAATLYRYTGDRQTEDRFKNALCTAVMNNKYRCIRGRNGNMLVRFDSGRIVVVPARRLRKFAL
ncbi:MAG: hypothetical protein INR69_12565 [Mucilaginibacter polytrichastri]|nr:hypothetical protein [Mucilaginibacter polytrichastri]